MNQNEIVRYTSVTTKQASSTRLADAAHVKEQEQEQKQICNKWVLDTDGSDATEVPPATSSKIPKKSQHANSRHTLSPWRVIIMIISSPRPGSYTCADDVASLCSVLRH